MPSPTGHGIHLADGDLEIGIERPEQRTLADAAVARQHRALVGERRAQRFEALAARGAGPPDRIIEQLKAVEKQYPALERIGMSHPMGTPQSVITEQLEWFGKEVMPAFKGK